MARPIHEIAREIRKTWPKPYFGAVPYIEAMQEIDSINDAYYADSASSVVMYFLANANTWRGDDARRIKAELKEMLKCGNLDQDRKAFCVPLRSTSAGAPVADGTGTGRRAR